MALSGTVLLALGANVATAELSAAVEATPFSAFGAAAGISDAAAAWWAALVAAWKDGFRHAPALLVGLVTMLAVPPLAILGLLLARSRRDRNNLAVHLAEDDNTTARTRADGLTWPVDAWIEIEGQPASRRPVVLEILRIGRDDDNDLVVPVETVHRYHAVINRTEDAEIVVIDVSGSDGNGVLVNGKRVSRQRLKDGDTLELGKARLKFSARRVGAIAPHS